MGLDMYAFKVKADAVIDDFNYKRDEDFPNSKEIFYWRKHHNLHGWMENLYHEKGGTGEVFNCIPLRLTLEDLDELEKDVKSNNLPHTEGFFFGNNPPDALSIENDKKFIEEAREVLNKGLAVYYDSWW